VFRRSWKGVVYAVSVVVALYGIAVGSLLITTIIRNELQIWGGREVPALAGPEGSAHLHMYVRNVFGDPLPYAVIYVAGRVAQADSTGFVELAGLKPGRYEMAVFAGGYQPLTLEVHLEPGRNSPVIKYDTGLWPEDFLVDFHLYHSSDQRLMGMLGFANGSAEPIYIHRAALLSPQGGLITDFLHDGDGFAYFAGLSTKITVVEEPQRALVWPPRTWQPGEFPPIPGSFQAGTYTLEIHYGSEGEHQAGEYRTLRINNHLYYDLTGNPHSGNGY
jgi:hypothetical protein